MSRRLMVLGGTSGIGKAAFDLLDDGLVYDSAQAYGEGHFSVINRLMFRAELAALRPTDLVYSVGINKLDWIADIEPLDFSDVMATNVYGFLNMIRLLDEMDLGPCNVVAVTSDAAWRPMRTSAIYCASKAALEMCVRVASREYAAGGWRINAVAPGKVEDTPMTAYVDRRVLELRGWTAEHAEAYEVGSSPLGRKVTKVEVAQVIKQVLLGPPAQTGEIIAVNGGR